MKLCCYVVSYHFVCNAIKIGENNVAKPLFFKSICLFTKYCNLNGKDPGIEICSFGSSSVYFLYWRVFRPVVASFRSDEFTQIWRFWKIPYLSNHFDPDKFDFFEAEKMLLSALRNSIWNIIIIKILNSRLAELCSLIFCFDQSPTSAEANVKKIINGRLVF